MSEEIKSLKNYISTTKNEIFTTFKIETISNLIIYYEDLQQKVEQLEEENIKQKEIIENLTTMAVCGDKKQIKNTAQYKLEQLENIIKEAIEYIDGHTFYYTDTPYDLLNILNKGDNK